MQRYLAAIAVLGAILAAPAAQAETPASITIADPAVFAAQLREMGYAPDPFSPGEVPTSLIHSGSNSYGVVLGGCTNGKDCSYVVLFGSFTDIVNPPADWVAKHNVDYDVIKVWLNDSKELTYSTPVVANGLPRASFRAAVDLFIDSGQSLAREALTDGLADQKK